MNDMTAVIIPRSDQWNADDLLAGPRTITVTGVKITPGTEQPVAISFAGSDKVFRPCKSMSRVLVAAWGPDATKYTGRSLTLYRDARVKWGGLEVGGIRIGEMSHISGPLTMALAESKAVRKAFTVKPLAIPTHDATAAPDDEARAEVAGWVSRTLKAIAGTTDRTALATVQGKRAPTLATARESFPDLASQVDAAYLSRATELGEG